MKILDLTAGNRSIWYDKGNPLVTFLDIRPEMKPDVVCDTRSIPDSIGSGFGLVVYDPPHMNVGPNGHMAKRYGHFTTEDILDAIQKTSKEAHRVSAENALMAFKWNDHDIRFERVLALMDDHWQPLCGNVSKFLHRSTTKWILLKRRSENEQ